jgi:hypothetical protein
MPCQAPTGDTLKIIRKFSFVMHPTANHGGVAIIGNIDLADPRLSKHFLTISIEQGGRWFHLARYHDHDYGERGPEQLASFLGLQVEAVFPIAYNVTSTVRGQRAAARGEILAEPDE